MLLYGCSFWSIETTARLHLDNINIVRISFRCLTNQANRGVFTALPKTAWVSRNRANRIELAQNVPCISVDV